MLLCPVKGLPGIDFKGVRLAWRVALLGLGWCAGRGCWVCGQDRDGPLRVEGKLLLGHAQQVRWGPGAADESFEGKQGCGSRLSGQAAPGAGVSAGGAEVGVNLAGDVTLETAHDLGLGFAFCRAALGVGAGGRVGAHAGEHDPPQGMVGLAVAAGVEAVADGLA